MTLMPEVHDALVRAFTAGAAPRRRHRWWRARRGWIALVAAIATSTAIAATAPWRPDLGTSEPSSRPLPVEQLAHLSILRQPQTAADRGPLVQEALRHLDRRLHDGIRTDAIRLIFQNAREVTILVPVERAGPPKPARGELLDALCLMSSSFSSGTQRTPDGDGDKKASKPRPGFNNWSTSCGTFDQLLSRGIVATTTSDLQQAALTGPTSKRLRLHRVVLVPDKVKTATVRLRDGRTIQAVARRNTYRYTSHSLTPEFSSTVWRDRTGRAIKR